MCGHSGAGKPPTLRQGQRPAQRLWARVGMAGDTCAEARGCQYPGHPLWSGQSSPGQSCIQVHAGPQQPSRGCAVVALPGEHPGGGGQAPCSFSLLPSPWPLVLFHPSMLCLWSTLFLCPLSCLKIRTRWRDALCCPAILRLWPPAAG